MKCQLKLQFIVHKTNRQDLTSIDLLICASSFQSNVYQERRGGVGLKLSPLDFSQIKRRDSLDFSSQTVEAWNRQLWPIGFRSATISSQCFLSLHSCAGQPKGTLFSSEGVNDAKTNFINFLFFDFLKFKSFDHIYLKVPYLQETSGVQRSQTFAVGRKRNIRHRTIAPGF